MTRSHEAQMQPDHDAIHAANVRFVLGNAATNGRLFIVGLVAVDLSLFAVTGAYVYAGWALITLLGAGFAFLADRLPGWMEWTRKASSILAIALPAGSFLATIAKIMVL